MNSLKKRSKILTFVVIIALLIPTFIIIFSNIAADSLSSAQSPANSSSQSSQWSGDNTDSISNTATGYSD